MDFQNINSLNVRLNLLSSNLLSMTSDSSFPIFWRIYNIFVWLFELFYTVSLISSFFFIPKEKAINDGMISVVIIEIVIMITRIHSQTTLVQQLIRKLNKALSIEDENMRNIVITNLKRMDTPFKFYLIISTVFYISFCCMSLPLVFEKNTFYYSDFKVPAIYSKEPFSSNIFVMGSILILISNLYIFIKKVSVDIYTTHLISLITAQYQYIASRFILIFRNDQWDNNNLQKNNSRVNSSIKKEIKILCRQHNAVICITLMLKKLLSLNILLIYINNVFRFCFIGLILTKISTSFLEGCMIIMYGSGSIKQFYILCSCVQQLSEASTELTDKAFHEDWYRFDLSVKHIFLLVIIASST
ncbi:uncharacterized protein LOC112552774 [Pogonomyrmex barbatus]|uniref:Odorant receptor n=1 Tax=Pogonomyrmex barbatus TaxID=144034 RepID=A0A8N1S751_9HYME|nr:uncharacterized protein LOC112552774 [Pogonomyrmex barbatus]